jgi:hypothetical protein
MSEHKADWLGQLLDGEMKGERLAGAEAHLAHCATCRAELDELRRLSVLLQEVPAAEGLASPASFVARVEGRLNGRGRPGFWHRALPVGRWIAPAALAGAWVFLQTLAIAAPLILLAVQAGAGGETLGGLLPVTGESWWAALADLSATGLGDLTVVLDALPRVVVDLGWSLALASLPLVCLALLFGAWLVFWWSRGRLNGFPATAVGDGG